jgi:phosphatidylserine decarboxylase
MRNPPDVQLTTAQASDVLDRLAVLPQYLLPQRLLSRIVRAATRWRWRPWKNFLIRWFIRRYGVDMSIAERPSPEDYLHFNDFFTRRLKPGARFIDADPKVIVSPVDGIISQLGHITGETLIQAKGRDYDLTNLLGGELKLAEEFRNGGFITLYLAPRDYHRVHMPLEGALRKMIYVPGRLFSVNEVTTRTVPNLFARNERIICLFDTEAGPMAVILVGAMLVSCMETVWFETLPLTRGLMPLTWNYPPGAIRLDRGAELGRFNMGSTVIVLFGPGKVKFTPLLTPDRAVKLGEVLATHLK